MKDSCNSIAFAVVLLSILVVLWREAKHDEEDNENGIPVIDLAMFRGPDATSSSRAQVIKEWDEALQEYGFMVVTNHGVENATIGGLFNAAGDFFAQSLEEKLKSYQGMGYGPSGYTAHGIEAVGRSANNEKAAPDLVENYVFNRGVIAPDILPEKPEEFVSSARAYWDEICKLLSLLHEISALALGLDPRYFDQFYEGAERIGSYSLRMAHYPAVSSFTKDSLKNAIRYGEHTDYTGFTVLRVEHKVPGLEVRLKDQSWLKVQPVKDGLIINAGDLIQRWSNDRWISSYHRVNNPEVGSEDYYRSRISLVFFSGPHNERLIEPILTSENPVPLYEPILAGEHLLEKLMRSNV